MCVSARGRWGVGGDMKCHMVLKLLLVNLTNISRIGKNRSHTSRSIHASLTGYALAK